MCVSLSLFLSVCVFLHVLVCVCLCVRPCVRACLWVSVGEWVVCELVVGGLTGGLQMPNTISGDVPDHSTPHFCGVWDELHLLVPYASRTGPGLPVELETNEGADNELLLQKEETRRFHKEKLPHLSVSAVMY